MLEKFKYAVYVAGAIAPTGQGHPVMEFLTNERRGIRGSVEVLLRGYAVFCPFVDFLYWLVLNPGEEIKSEMIYQNSLAMMSRCDAVLVLPGSENSKGTKAEIEQARRIGVPVFRNLEIMENYFHYLEGK